MAAAANRDWKKVIPATIHRSNNVGNIHTPCDEQRPLVDHAIVESASVVIVGVASHDQLTAKRLPKLIDTFVAHRLLRLQMLSCIAETKKEGLKSGIASCLNASRSALNTEQAR